MPARAAAQCKVVLITGCGSGIGWAAAETLARAGHVVWATARRAESVAELETLARDFAGTLHAMRLDVTDPATIAPVVRDMLARERRIDVLINNAGFGQLGAVEDVPVELWRRQLETNLFGVLAVTQAVLPAMRAAGTGRIINVSSVAAHVAVPLMGAYCASKHALEAASSALRIEVAPFGIEVVLIEPGPIATRFRPNVQALLEADPVHEGSAYADMYRALDAYHAQPSGPPRGHRAEDVARVIQRAVESRRPRTRYRVTAIARWLPRVLPFVPDRLLDRFMRGRLRGGR